MARRFPLLVGSLVALLSGVTVLLFAAPASASDKTVTFTGSSLLGALSCGSDPDQSAVSITSADTLTVVNKTGQTAAVYVNGKPTSHSLDTNQSVPITFPTFDEGTTQAISLVPSCLLLNLSEAGSVGVSVTAPVQAQMPDPVPVPTHTTAPAPTTAAGGGSSATSKPSRTPKPPKTPKPSKSAKPSGAPTSPAPVTVAPTTDASTSAGPLPVTASTSPSTLASTATRASAAPHSATKKKTSDGTIVTGSGPESVNIGVAQALPAADISPAAPDYLLVIIALISVLGVGSASVRAVLTQRRSRRAAW